MSCLHRIPASDNEPKVMAGPPGQPGIHRSWRRCYRPFAFALLWTTCLARRFGQPAWRSGDCRALTVREGAACRPLRNVAGRFPTRILGFLQRQQHARRAIVA